MEEENEKAPERAEEGAQADAQTPDLGKFKSAEALLRAYGALEAEFTRRSQRLKALEERLSGQEEAERAARDSEELYRAVTKDEGVRARILGEYLQSLKGVPLMAGGAGTGVTAPAARPKSIKEAGELALGYLRNHQK